MLLRNATAVVLAPRSIDQCDLRIDGAAIVETGHRLVPAPGEEVYDLGGKIVLPGFICAHTHLYSALARGMPPPSRAPQDFLDILRSVWWKLDRALDEESMYYSALVGSIDAVRSGTTTLIDHHASPRAIGQSLGIIRQAMEEIGLRGVLCYEVTDRGGEKERDLGLRENERFIRESRSGELFRGLVGAHAAFTLSEKSLRLCGELAGEYRTGVHVHAAEDRADVDDAAENYCRSVVDRLRAANCLTPSSICAHGVHLTRNDIRHIQESKSWLVHNPRSNMNNSVGYAPVHHFGERTAVGTDGFPADMFEEARAGFFKMKDSKTPPSDIVAKLQAGQQLVSEIFGRQFGKLMKGSVADLVLLDYDPPTPMTLENLPGHFLFGMRSSDVGAVMVAGKWVVRDRAVIGVDLPLLYAKARKAAKKLWTRMEKLT